MAIDFATGALLLGRNTNPPATAAPLTISAWVAYPTTDMNTAMTVCLSDGVDPTPSLFMLQVGDGGQGQWKAYAAAQTPSANGSAETAGGPASAALTWVHACAVFTSATSRAAFITGATKGTDTTSVSPSGIVQTFIGGFGSSAYASQWISDAAVWNVALSDAEVAALARGMSPLFVRPSALQAYWPLQSVASAGLNRFRNSTDRSLSNFGGTETQAASNPPVGQRFHIRQFGWRGNAKKAAVVLVGNGFAVASPALEAPLAAARSVLVAPDLAPASPSLGAAGLVQGHALAASDLVPASPSIAVPAVKQAHALLASDAVAGAPALDAPAANQRAVLTASAFAASSPVMASGFVAQAGVLASVPVAVGSPIIGAPAFAGYAVLWAAYPEMAGVPTPALDIDFVHDPDAKSKISCARAGPAYLLNEDTGNFELIPANAPRVHRTNGLLVEPARTNYLRNNSMQGAAAGSPGTNPTNWGMGATFGGLTKQIVGVGTENGIDYIDVRWSGTTSSSANGSAILDFEGHTQIVAASGQFWTASVFAYLVGGSFANISAFTVAVVEADAAGTALVASAAPNTATSGPLARQRATVSRTLNNASTARVYSRLQVSFASGVAVDMTIRIGWPQLELSQFVTTPIRTATVGIARAADSITILNQPTVVQSGGGLFAEYVIPNEGVATTTNYYIFGTDDAGAGATNAMRTLLYQNPTTKSNALIITTAAVTAATLAAPTNSFVYGAINRQALRYATDDVAWSANAATPLTDALAPMPTVTRMQIGQLSTGGVQAGLYFRRVKYFDTGPTNAELVLLTTTPPFVGSPVLGVGAMTIMRLLASPPTLAPSAPALDAGALGQKHVLAATSMAVSAPAVGSATLTQAHTFVTLFEPQLSIGPTVDLAFAYRRTDVSQITVTRTGGAAMVDDSRGNWSPVGANLPRISDKGLLIEELVSNWVPNNSWQGAVVGGALPSLWAFSTGTLTREVVGLGVEANGVEYIDLRLSGLPGGGTGPWAIRAPSTAIASGAGAPWSASAWFKLIAGNFSGFNGTPPLTLRIADEGGGTQFTPDGNWTRITNSRLLATNTLGQWCLRFATIDAVTPIDVTIRIGWPQVENFASARSPVRTTTAAVGKPADLVALVTPPGSFPASGGLFVEYSVPRAPLAVAGNHYLLQVSDGSASNRALLYLSFTNANNKRFVVSNAAVSQGDIAVVGAYPYNDAIGRLAARFIDNDMRSAADGTLSAADNACIVPTNFTSLNIGGASPFTTAMDGYIRRVKYFNQPLTDNDLQLLTGGPGVSSPVLGQGLLQQKHVLVPVGITVASTAPPAATFAQENALEAVDKTVGAPVLGVSTITGQGHALLPPAFSESSPVLGVGALKQKQVLAATAAAAGHPVLGVGLFVQAGTCVASPLATSAPQFGVAGIKQVHAIAAPRLSLSSGPIVGSSKAVIKAPPLFAANLTVQSPNISPLRPAVGFVNILAFVPDFHVGRPEFLPPPDAELIAPPEVYFKVREKRWSRDPNAEFYDDDDTQHGAKVKQAIFVNVNDALDLILSSGTLAGRTTAERGPAEDIIVGYPLWLEDKRLRVDWSEVDQLRDDVNALMAAVTINTAALDAAVAAIAATSAQQAINVAAIAANTALLVALRADFDKLLRQLKVFIPRDLVAGAPILGTPRAATRLPAATNVAVSSPVLGHPTLVRLTI